MTLRHGGFPFLDAERWSWMAGRRGDGGRDEEFLAEFNGPHSGGRITWLSRSRYDFGWGFQLGRNGGESDIGLDLHAGRWAHTWLRLRAPWLKFVRIEQGKPDWYEARHTGFKVHPHEGCYVSWGIDTTAKTRRKSDPWWRRGSIGSHQLWGPKKGQRDVLDEASPRVRLPEGLYDAKATLVRYTTRHTRWPGTWLDRRRGLDVHESWQLDIEDGIPVEGKGTESYNCEMDGTFGISGGFSTVADACNALVQAVLRDRQRYGGPHNLPRPMTVTEAEEWQMARRS